MKNLSILILSVVLMFGVSISSLYAEETKVSGSASVDIMSNYMWRGIRLSNSYVVQPSVGITYGGFGANLWSNWDGDLDNQGELTETDLTLNYTFSIDKVSLDVGYIYYGFEAADDTQEIYVSAGYDILFNPALTIYLDFDEGDGAFIIASVGHDIELTKDVALSLGGSISYNLDNEYSHGDFSDFYNGEISASVSIPVGKNISVGPKIAYSFPLSDDAEFAIEEMSDGDSSMFYGGASFALSF